MPLKFLSRSLPLHLLACCLLAALSGILSAAPNILIVLSDDQSEIHMGVSGNTSIQTPRLDQFAAESMRFTRAFCTSPQCAPARKSLLTGRSPVALQQTLFTVPLQRDAITLPELLKSGANYFTGFAGRDPHLDGRFEPTLSEIAAKYNLRTTAERVDFYHSASGPDGDPRAIMCVTQFETFLKKVPQDKPFFVQLGFSDPHRGWDKTPHPVKHDPAKIVLPPDCPDLPLIREDLANYYDEVARLDYYFGVALDMLKDRGLDGNTIVIFMGDNGAAVLRGKGTLYQKGINVPFMIRWPGVVTPGVTNALVSGEDLTPTLLAVNDLPIPADMTGKSFLPLLKGEAFTPRTHVFAERGPHVGLPKNSATYDEIRTVVGERFKLIYNAIPRQPFTPLGLNGTKAWKSVTNANKKGKLPPPFRRLYFYETKPIFELYDLQNDPDEFVNLADNPSYLEARQNLQKIMLEKMILERDYLPLPLSTVNSRSED